ncbi:MAG: NHLP bacteriocin export ABC transporter permease/ATPase subunit [bacterium]|nr:NHLP bacteriocin export ABC transporter permease/ATPase subunit [bacterium]
MTDHDTQAVTLAGSDTLQLGDPTRLWVVESGSLALFSVERGEGAAAGARRFFFKVGAGDLLCGLPSSADDAKEMIAVALTPASLRRVARLDPTAPAPGSGRDGAALATQWLVRWSKALEKYPVPPAGDGPLPGSLAASHAAIVQKVAELEGREEKQRRERLMAREQRTGEVVQEALGELTSILDPRETHPPEGSDLFVAATVVGRAAGIELQRPPAWEHAYKTGDPVETIARASHIRVRRVVLHDGWHAQDCGPILAFLGEERLPIALLPLPSGGYDYFDAMSKARGRVDETFAERLDPSAFVFYRPLPDWAARGMGLFKFALTGRGRDLALVLLTAGLATLLGMFTPQATALLIDHAIPDDNRNLLFQIGLGLFGAAMGIAVFRWAQGVAMLRIETGADAVTQAAVWDRLLNLQLSFFRRFATGDLNSRVTAITQIRALLGGTTMRTLFSGVILLMNLALLLYYSRILTLLAIVVAAVSAVVTIVSGVLILRCTREILELRGKFFGLMVQLINGVSKLRVAAAEERAFGRWARDYSQLVKLELKQLMIGDAVEVVNIGVAVLSSIALFSVAATLIRDETATLTTGVFLAFNVAYGTFIGAITSVSNTITDVLAIAILRERAKPILDAEPEVNERKADPGRLRGEIRMAHVGFKYREDGPQILDDVTFEAEAGQFVALVGTSGSGKSTLFRLLLGFETPAAGRVLFDGQDVSGLDVHSVRRQLGVVLQNGRINAGSLFDNIATGTQITLNDAWEAARAAGFEDDVRAMPMGMHTIVGEGGTGLSGGQRQRLLITRALVHKPRILLLDEATSALDNTTQAIVTESLQQLEVTRIVIAHRLSTVESADQIYVLDGGRIAESGSFAELASGDGLFSRLMARQLT